MTRFVPRTLFGQMVLILLAGLLVSHLVGTLIYASDREHAVRMVGGFGATQRIANLARLIDEAPADWRNRIVAAVNDPTLRVTLSPQPPAFAEAGPDTDFLPIRQYLAEQLPAPLVDRLHVAVAPAGPPFMHAAHHMPMHGPPWMPPPGTWRGLQAAMQLNDGQWLAFATAFPSAGPRASWAFFVPMAVMAVIVVLASVWAVRRVTTPLGVIAHAAERLGHDVNAPPIAEAGTREMRQAVQSFNQMQARILRLLDNRTRMLAALSHDLRTPLTLLRLRTENLQEAEERERMLATIGELDAMIEASLNFARDQATAETWRRTDVTALLASIIDDMADAGMPVSMTPAEPVVLECQPGALRRALTNLIDNAVKYGQSARAAIVVSPLAVRIDIDDNGPGIPPAELQRVFEPFHRLEQSRSRDTGGTGLGLPIALSIVQAHRGDITLTNCPDGGLRASVSLPR